jgi:hypothetical protein
MRVVVLVVVLLIVVAVGYVGASVWLEWQPVWGYFQIARRLQPGQDARRGAGKVRQGRQRAGLRQRFGGRTLVHLLAVVAGAVFRSADVIRSNESPT